MNNELNKLEPHISSGIIDIDIKEDPNPNIILDGDQTRTKTRR